jgi:hypothetical protein
MGQASENSIPPRKQRRRRWLIVAFVLVLVTMTSWWNWPRGDARFVGKWRRFAGSERVAVMELRANGTGAFIPDSGVHTPIVWIVSEDGLRLTQSVPSWLRPCLMSVAKLFTSKRVFDFRFSEGLFRLKTVAANEVVLHSDHGQVVMLRRIQE